MEYEDSFFDDFPDEGEQSILSDERLLGKDFLGFLEQNNGDTIIGVWQNLDAENMESIGTYLAGDASIVDLLFDLGGFVEQGMNYFVGTLDWSEVNPQNLRGSGFISFEDATSYILSNNFLQDFGEIFESGGLYYVQVNYPPDI